MTAADAGLKKTILVVDSDRIEKNVRAIHDIFDETYCVLSAENDTEAIHLMRHQKINLVLLLVAEPGVDSDGIILAMKADAALSSIPIIVMFDKDSQVDTDRRSATDRLRGADNLIDAECRAFDVGADDFVTLPIAAVILKSRVARLIRCYGLQSDLTASLVEAKAANRAKTAFLSRISHDMRTPLNGIMGLTTLMQSRVTDEQDKKDLRDMEMSGRYLLNLINDTLDMSRIESGQITLHPVVCESSSLFENVLRLAKNSMQGRDIRFNVHIENHPCGMVYVDVSRIEQIMLNVFGNAVKFTPDGGEIALTIKNKSVTAALMVDEVMIRDTGIGMSSDFLPHIFEPFVQADNAKNDNYHGTGLGMAITKQLLQRMGGDIVVESAPGKGSCFTILLKMQMATAAQIAAWHAAEAGTVNEIVLQDKKVLLCEDHPLNASIAVRLLEAKGMQVDVAENGQTGLERFMHSAMGSYDVILMDIRMPVMDGIHAAKAIRSLRRDDAQSIPIIAMTANAFFDDVQETKASGMDAHLSKPIQAEVLYHTVAQALSDSK